MAQYFPYAKGSNMLLLRDDVGRSKTSHYNLPNQNFTYGKPLNRDKEGAKEILEEVLREGSDEQQAFARTILNDINANA